MNKLKNKLTIVAGLMVIVSFLLSSSGYPNKDKITCQPGNVLFATTVDLNKDESPEIVVGMTAGLAKNLPEFCAPGEVYIFELDPKSKDARSYKQVFEARTNLPEEIKPYIYSPQSIKAVKDIDSDQLPEVVLEWSEKNWWPTAVGPLSILQFDIDRKTYELAFNTKIKVSELGGFNLENVDKDELIEIIQLDAVWEAGECHYCAHKYRIEVFEFDGESFIHDRRCNNGRPFVTEKKFHPSPAGDRIADFLPELMEVVYSFCHRK